NPGDNEAALSLPSRMLTHLPCLDPLPVWTFGQLHRLPICIDPEPTATRLAQEHLPEPVPRDLTDLVAIRAVHHELASFLLPRRAGSRCRRNRRLGRWWGGRAERQDLRGCLTLPPLCNGEVRSRPLQVGAEG